MEKTMLVFCFGQLEQSIPNCRDVHFLRNRHLVPLSGFCDKTRSLHYREDIFNLRVKKIHRKDTLLLQPHPHEGHTARRELNEIENLNAAKPFTKARVFLKIGLQRFVSLYSGHQPGYGEVGIAY